MKLIKQKVTKKSNNKDYHQYKITLDKNLIKELDWKKGDDIEQKIQNESLKLTKVKKND